MLGHSRLSWLGLLTLVVAPLGPAGPWALADGGMVALPSVAGYGYDCALGSALDTTNGRIYVSGFGCTTSANYSTLAGSVLVNGDLNTSFGGGVVLTPVAAVVSGYRGRDASSACVVQPDGKLVSGGWYVEGKPTRLTYGIALVRYNPDGTLDTTFNPQYDRKGRIIGGGIVKTSFGANQAQINAIALQGDRILVTGRYFGLARYTTDGRLDSTFGSGGLVSMPAGIGRSIALHAGGIVVGASAAQGMAVIRFTENGALDTSFGTGGVATFAVPDPDPGTYTELYAIAVDHNADIVVAGKFSDGEIGNYHYRVAVARFIGSGQDAGDLDPTFGGGNGYVTFPPGLTDDYVAEAVAVDGDGKIVVAGYVASEGVTSLLVARFDEWGNPDPAFNGVGYAADFPGDAHAVFVQPDGKIVAAGAIADLGSSPQTSTIVIVRYLGDGTPDPSF